MTILSTITYRVNHPLNTNEVIAVYDDSGLKRPTHDRERISRMFAHANLVISAWDGSQLIGIARALTDFCYCCYLSDLAVKAAYQHSGIGKMLIEKVKQETGDQSMLLLLSAPTAMEYYPKIGMETVNNGFIIHRKV